MRRIFYSFVVIVALFLTGCADAGKDQVVHSGDTVTLDGSASTPEAGGHIERYRWKQIRGKRVALSGKEKVQATFTAPAVTQPQKLVFQLTTVEVGGRISSVKSRDRVTIKVLPAEIDTTPPVITLNGDANLTLNVGDTYTEPGATAIDDRDGNVSVEIDGVVDTSKAGTYTVTYTARDKAGNSSSKQRVVTVKDKPKIVLIFTGKAKSDFATSSNSVLLEGYTYANDTISDITCTNELTNVEEVAAGKEKWDVNMTLQVGDNKIECTAKLADSDITSKRTVTITYYDNSAFTSLLHFEEDTFFVDETKVIKANIGVDYNISKSIIVKLYELDSNGTLKDPNAMYDNGVLPDEIDKDGIFTVHATLNETNPANHCYRVGVIYDNENEFFSEVKCVHIIKHITQEQMQNFMSIGEDIKKIYAENNDTKTAAQKAYDTLVNDPRIGAIGINDDGESLWYVSVDGIAGGHSVFREGKKAAPKEEVKSKKGLIISPYINNPNDPLNSWPDGESDDDYSVVWKYIKNKKSCRLKATTEKINNGSVSVQVDDFKHLSDYGYIHISTHGDNWFSGLIDEWDDEWGDEIWLDSISEVVLYTGNKIIQDSNGTWIYGAYEKDIATHRIVMDGDGYIVITPAFIDRYVSGLPDSIVMLSACRSAINGSMANAFIARGAKTVLGYSDYVLTGYTQDTTSTFVKELYNDKTTGEAFAQAIKQHGVDDGNYGSKSDHARFTLFGSQNLKLASGRLVNLGFEEATLKPWKKVGDGRLIAQLGSSSPTEGKYMGIISTGLGYTTQAGSIEQAGCLDNNESTLRFDWNFFSEEFKEYCNSQYQDTFKVVMCEVKDVNGTMSKSNCSTLFIKTIDDLCGSVHKVSNTFDQGDVYATGWQTQEVDISSYAGKSISLQFYATDVGDSVYDSAILIDNIKFK